MLRRTLPFLTLLWLSSYAAAQVPAVTSTVPPNERVDTNRGANIDLNFDTQLKGSTVNASTVRVFGRWSGPAAGSVSLRNSGTRIRFNPSTSFFAGERVTVSVSGVVESATGTPFPGYSFSFWAKTDPGTLDMQQTGTMDIRESGEGAIFSYGAYAGDLDNDGWSDLMVPNEVPSDARVFMNNSGVYNSSFTKYVLPGGSNVSPNEGADFDADGEIDVAIGSSAGTELFVMFGNGSGGFPTIDSYTGGREVRGVCVMDIEMDGDDDIVTANRDANYVGIYINDGAGNFAAEVNIEGGGNGEDGCAVADANNDGFMDLFVGFNFSSEVGLLLGDGNGNLTFSSKVSVGGRPWMLATGDMNGDGNADVITANSLGASGSVILGNGSGGLGAATDYPVGSFVVATDVGDLDGDGDLDATFSNVNSGDFSVYENNGSGGLINKRTYPASQLGSCTILHDRDNDGDLDITAIDEGDDILIFLENNGLLPVEGLILNVRHNSDEAYLNWETQSETNNAGFEIQRRDLEDPDMDAWTYIDFVEGNGTVSTPSNYFFTVPRHPPGLHTYRLKQVNFDGSFSYSNSVEVDVVVSDPILLDGVFPNPTSGTATVRIRTGVSDQSGRIVLFDAIGREISVLHDGSLQPSRLHLFTLPVENLSGGVYFLRVQTNHTILSEKVIINR